MNMASHSTGSVFPFFYTGNLPTPAGAVRRCGLPFPTGRGPGSEAPPPRPLSFPHSPLICSPDGDWQLQVLPGAPGTARQGRTRSIIVSTNDGGTATQPRAPGHDRPRTASSGAARHGRPRATLRAPGADVPPTITAGAPGQYCLSAALRAPGHGSPLAISAEAPCRDRLSAVPPAPDHDRSDARHTMAPGHGRPLAASSDVVRHDRPRATTRAPGADVPPGHHGRGAGSAPSACHGERHRRLAGRPTPAAPGGLAPRPCQPPHPDLPTLPPHRLVIPAPTEIRACAHQRRRGATCCARPPARRRDHRGAKR